MKEVTFYFQWEAELMRALQSAMGPVSTAIASFFTMFGEEMVLIAVLGFLYWAWDKKAGRFIGLNIMVGLIACPMVKNLVFRQRPYFDIEGVKCLKPVDKSADIYDINAQGFSFPSGHSVNAVTLFGSLPAYFKGRGSAAAVRMSRILWILAISLPLLCGASRVMLGVHYPTDVLVGWLLGGVIVAVFSALQRKVRRRGLLYLIVFLVSCAGVFYCKTSDYWTGLGMMAGFFLAIPFEERFTRFENTRNPLRMILRVAGGFALFFGLNKVLKLPFSEEFLARQTYPSFLARAGRYAVILFVLMAVYPMAFRLFSGKKQTN